MKFLFPLLLTAAAACASVTITHVFPSGLAVPDNNITGLADSRVISGQSGPIQQLTVSLELSGGWNGDLYAHLVHETGFAVLLNRIGRSASNTVGSGSSGLHAVFDDSAAFDIHLLGSTAGQITGTWQPDARTGDPDAVTNASPRDALLSSFNGLSAQGRWTLFLADLSPGGTSTLSSWSLQLTTVPEPRTGLLGAGVIVFAILVRKRSIVSHRTTG